MLEDPFVHEHSLHVPRASLVVAAGEAGNSKTEIWMGGAHSLAGEAVEGERLAGGWVIDCAGDLPPSFRGQAGRWTACVFPDLDGPLSSSNRVAGVVADVVQGLTTPGDVPERIFVMCQHGMNRSGLVTGLILRGLGFEPSEAIERIRLARPGALANDYFRRMLLQTP